jgi:hypothetical protein
LPIAVAFVTYHWAAQLAAEDMRLSASAVEGGPLVLAEPPPPPPPPRQPPPAAERVEEVAGHVARFAGLAAGIAIVLRGRRRKARR